ncbi:protein kinase domain-containing protein [Vibrio astriarenae]|uniref:protein kinase domain-containing protein n=1 Tax=Vibrio astriarenae TaxID=1481923 RepID=UPI0037362C3D
MNSPNTLMMPKLSLSFGGYSDKGRRQDNQDAFVINIPEKHHELTHKGVVACIADGVSCSEQSQKASHTAVMQFIADYYATPYSWSIKSSANKILTSLNAWLFEQGTQSGLSHNGLVTTFSVLVIKSNTAHIFHVGDSRIYLMRDNKLQQLTRDHQRVNFGKAAYLTRALGMDNTLEVDYQTVPLQLEDRFLLSTDGVHDYLSDEQIGAALADKSHHAQSNSQLETASQALCHSALKNQSQDNLSALIVEINQLPNHSQLEYQQNILTRAIPPALAEGNTLEGYHIDKVLHAGTRSHVYQVTEQSTGEQYVLKTPSEYDADNALVLQQFANEYWVSTQLNSEHIMKMYPTAKTSQFIYQLCEHIEGVTLRQWMYDNPMPELSKVRVILDEIVKALRIFQRAEMVHRDLKPENIMITTTGAIKIIDFGAVKVSSLEEFSDEGGVIVQDETPLGALNYIAPEYIDTGIATTTSDLFSVAVIGYEMLTGTLPYKPTTSQNVQKARHTQWQYHSINEYRQDIPNWIDFTFRKATHHLPQRRYEALSEFVVDLYTPNQKLQREFKEKPLLQRQPVVFWKLTTLILFAVALIQFIMLLS